MMWSLYLWTGACVILATLGLWGAFVEPVDVCSNEAEGAVAAPSV